MHCPPDDLMCGDPGLLTCVDTHNDCSGKGDCYMGSCYCHTGWGGDDCSVPICYDSCPNVRPSPHLHLCIRLQCLGVWFGALPCNSLSHVFCSSLPLLWLTCMTHCAGERVPGFRVLRCR